MLKFCKMSLSFEMLLGALIFTILWGPRNKAKAADNKKQAKVGWKSIGKWVGVCNEVCVCVCVLPVCVSLSLWPHVAHVRLEGHSMALRIMLSLFKWPAGGGRRRRSRSKSRSSSCSEWQQRQSRGSSNAAATVLWQPQATQLSCVHTPHTLLVWVCVSFSCNIL